MRERKTDRKPEDKKFTVWIEGFRATGEADTARLLGTYYAPTFQEACKMAINANRMADQYDEKENTHWARRLFDNETDARKSFG